MVWQPRAQIHGLLSICGAQSSPYRSRARRDTRYDGALGNVLAIGMVVEPLKTYLTSHDLAGDGIRELGYRWDRRFLFCRFAMDASRRIVAPRLVSTKPGQGQSQTDLGGTDCAWI